METAFITVFPQGYGNSWNLGSCCPPASSARVDDIAFLDAPTGYLAGRPDVDPDRVSLAGASLGGMMSYRYACGRSERLSGLVSVAGTHLGGCGPSSSLPTLQIHSIADEVVAYDGHPTATEVALGLNFPPVVPTLGAHVGSDR
jgi:polyhydroxybutyrate depolymerase